MNRPARTVPRRQDDTWAEDMKEGVEAPLNEAYSLRPKYTEWRGPDKPATPGVHIVAYTVLAVGVGFLIAVAILVSMVAV